jgi:hypothetical protein
VPAAVAAGIAALALVNPSSALVPGGQPFQANFPDAGFTIPAGGDDFIARTSLRAPSEGRRTLAIENVSVVVDTVPTEPLRVVLLEATFKRARRTVAVPMIRQYGPPDNLSQSTYVGTTNVTLFADPGSDVVLQGTLDTRAPGRRMRGSIGGSLIAP